MTTTTIRLPKDLKERVARAAERVGKTQHGFILEAIAEKAAHEEQRAAFVEAAEQRYGRLVSSGKTIAWSEMRRYLERRVSGAAIDRPKPRRAAR
jgi:predicted transcriptional regulator